MSVYIFRPDQVISAGHLNHEGGVDTDVSGTFIYKNGGTARFQTHCRVNLKCEGTIYGTKGRAISRKYGRDMLLKSMKIDS